MEAKTKFRTHRVSIFFCYICFVMIIDTILLRVAWSATYTYILLLFAAAAFVAYIARPRTRGEAVKHLYAGELETLPLNEDGSENGPEADSDIAGQIHPVLAVRCIGNGKVLFERRGFAGLTASGAVSLAVTTIGKDVEVMERVTYGYPGDAKVVQASFTVDLTGPEWRHIKWTDEDSGLWCAFTLHVREGISLTVPLKR